MPDEKYFKYMLESAIAAVAITQGKTKEEVFKTPSLIFALQRAVELVGENAAQVSFEGRMHNPRIPWARVIHISTKFSRGDDHFSVDDLWNTATEDLPPIIIELRRILPPELT